MKVFFLVLCTLAAMASPSQASLKDWSQALKNCIAKPDICATCTFSAQQPTICQTIKCVPQPSCANCKAYPTKIPGCAGLTFPAQCFACFNEEACEKLGCASCYPRTVLGACPSVLTSREPCYDVGLRG